MQRLAIALFVSPFLFSMAFAQWTPVDNPPDPFQGIQIFYAGEERIYCGMFDGRVFGSTDHAQTWVEVADGLPENPYSAVNAMAIHGDWFVMSRFGLLPENLRNFRSRRVAGEWTAWEPIAYQDETFVTIVIVGDALFAVREGGALVRSDDSGATWSPVAMPFSATYWRLFTHEGRLFAAEQVVNGGTVYRSDDLGATWTPIGAAFGTSFVCSDSYWQGRLMVGAYHGGGVGSFWSSTDLGDSWTEVTTLPTTYNINAMAIARDGRLTIGAVSGHPNDASIWLTDDLATWEDYTGDLPQEAWSFQSLVAHDGWFYKTGGTVTDYRAPQPAATGVHENPGPTGGLALAARPNPFRPATTLAFALPRPGPVRLSIHDAAGRLVRTLAHGTKPAGAHRVAWAGRDDAGRPVAAGVYFSRLEAGDVVVTERLVRLR